MPINLNNLNDLNDLNDLRLKELELKLFNLCEKMISQEQINDNILYIDNLIRLDNIQNVIVILI